MPIEPTSQNTPEELPEWVKDPVKAYEEIRKVRAEAAGHRQAAAELRTWREQQESEARQAAEKRMTEEKRFAELAEQYKQQVTAMQTQLEAARLSSLKTQIGAEVGLPALLINRLAGATEEEIRKDAESLKAGLGVGVTPSATPATPRQSTTPVPTGTPTSETPQQRLDRIRRGGGGKSLFGNDNGG